MTAEAFRRAAWRRFNPALTIVPVTLGEAHAFVRAHHRHHRPAQGGLFALAVAARDRIVGFDGGRGAVVYFWFAGFGALTHLTDALRDRHIALLSERITIQHEGAEVTHKALIHAFERIAELEAATFELEEGDEASRSPPDPMPTPEAEALRDAAKGGQK